jgi:D-alanine-D-alanine ligase
MPKINLALLYGGTSSERQVSVNSGQIVYEALDKGKYEIMRYDPRDQLKPFILDALDGKIDLVLPVLHGPYGEDGRLQGLMDMIGVPYVYSGVLSSALAMDKHKTKLVAKSAGLRTAKETVLLSGKKFKTAPIVKKLGLPIVVKPNELGSSVGISIVKTEAELDSAIKKAFGYGNEVLLEEYIKGRELTIGVYMDKKLKALPVVEIIPKVSEFFDYRAKYEPGGSQEVCPAQIPDKASKKLQRQALKVFESMGCDDLSRADFMWKEGTDKFYFLEINTIPGMTATSLAPQAAKAAGMELPAFLDKLIASALKRREEAKKKNIPELESQVREILKDVTPPPAQSEPASPTPSVPASPEPAGSPANAQTPQADPAPQPAPETPATSTGQNSGPVQKHSFDEILSQNNLG